MEFHPKFSAIKDHNFASNTSNPKHKSPANDFFDSLNWNLGDKNSPKCEKEIRNISGQTSTGLCEFNAL